MLRTIANKASCLSRASASGLGVPVSGYHYRRIVRDPIDNNNEPFTRDVSVIESMNPRLYYSSSSRVPLSGTTLSFNSTMICLNWNCGYLAIRAESVNGKDYYRFMFLRDDGTWLESSAFLLNGKVKHVKMINGDLELTLDNDGNIYNVTITDSCIRSLF